MSNGKILIIEDEKDLVKLLSYNLQKEGFKTVAAYDGESGLAQVSKQKPDVVLLDIMLPKLDGYEVCKRIRQKSKVPIIILTAKRDEFDRVFGLELGADDYVTKPFSVREIVARVKGITRRASSGKSYRVPVRIGHLEIDYESYQVLVQNKPIRLSPKEFEFLKCLAEADGRAISRDQLMEKVWGHEPSTILDTRTVDQHIARLREKLGSESKRIITVQNVGYRLKTD